MRQYDRIRQRTIEFAHYIVENNATIRQTANAFHISKSTVHKDVRQHLKTVDMVLYEKVADILETNLKERHIRGGIATKKKYEDLRLRQEQNKKGS